MAVWGPSFNACNYERVSTSSDPVGQALPPPALRLAEEAAQKPPFRSVFILTSITVEKNQTSHLIHEL